MRQKKEIYSLLYLPKIGVKGNDMALLANRVLPWKTPPFSNFVDFPRMVSAVVEWIKLTTPIREGPGSKPARV